MSHSYTEMSYSYIKIVQIVKIEIAAPSFIDMSHFYIEMMHSYIKECHILTLKVHVFTYSYI